jgi:2-oxoglutarate dehydrogenase E2 component (dihydrolipoamide succinyltransferase)
MGGDAERSRRRCTIEIRPMMYFALTYDHRLVDGRGAVTFLVRIKEALEDARLVLDL